MCSTDSLHKIIWVFGGTAVGKKTYIRKFLEMHPTFEMIWVEDGDKSLREIIAANQDRDIIIRWQWSREHLLAKIVEIHPDIPQEIHLVRTSPENQKQRSDIREPRRFGVNPETGIPMEFRPFQMLPDESKSVRWLCLGLNAYYGLPLKIIET